MKKIIIIELIVLIGLIGLVSSATITLQPGQCYNFTYQTATFNNVTNITEYSNHTETFCANETEDTSTGFCSINKTLDAGEIFSQHDNSCGIDFTCELNPNLTEHDVAFDVTADMEYIRITIGTDTKSYPRSADGFTYNGIVSVMCPSIVEVEEGDPQSLQDCLAILKNTKDLTSEERDAYNLCISERDNFKVEWETRGNEIENCNQKLGTRTEEKENCEEKVKASEITNWIFLIILCMATSWLIIQLVIKIKNSAHSGKGLFGK